MKRFVGIVAALILVAPVPATGQRTPRSEPTEKPSPVSVTRAATLRLMVASDTVGIFSCLSEANKLATWFPDQAVFEPQLGGKYHFRFQDEDGVWSGVVTEYIRGNTLGYTWMPPGATAESAVHFRLSPQGGETMVELTVSGFTTGPDLDKAIAFWSFYLENLKSVLEEGIDQRAARRKALRRSVRRRG